MSDGDRRTAVATLFVAAFALILAGVVTLGIGLLSDDGPGPALVALVASLGGLLLLGLGVIRRSGSRSAAG